MATPLEPTDTYEYDVFISYSHNDSDWIEKVLLPELLEHRLKVLTDKQFKIGRTSMQNMEHAVRVSRRTLVVLTPDWVNSQWAQYEGILTSYLDATGTKGRLMPLLLKPCQPPWQIEIRTRAEFVDGTNFTEQMTRLIRDIRDDDSDAAVLVQSAAEAQLPVAAPKAQTPPEYPPGSRLRGLVDRLKNDRVRHALEEFRLRFEQVCESIQRLADFKDIHDQLHYLQLHCYEEIVREASSLEDDDQAADDLTLHLQELRLILDEIGRVTSRTSFNDLSLVWVDELESAYQRAFSAVAARDEQELKAAAKTIDRVLGLQSAKINVRLNAAARQLNLTEVSIAMGYICEHGEAAELDEATLREVRDVRNAVEQLRENLRLLVRDHDDWQEADTELRRCASDPSELAESWAVVKLKVGVLAGNAEWAIGLRREEQRIDSALSANEPRQLQRFFRLYRRQAVDRFFRVDSMLKRQCDELRKVGEPLATIVRVLS
ncbi:MAG TPA: toll/interleukin-1 receptor domain-containing protein [Thermoanaerobaculia bacterium]|nr:toll/interleukin-1 receptor domain-containing protein [Thermoanaerobaculia bacterium]